MSLKIYISLFVLLLTSSFIYGQTLEELIDTPVQELKDKQIFQESEVVETYFKGTEVERLMKSGVRNIDIGVITITAGTLFSLGTLVLASIASGFHPNSSIDGKYPLAGLGIIGLGIIFRYQGKKKIAQSRELMSKSGIHYIGNTSSPELFIGTTDNVVGLILSF